MAVLVIYNPAAGGGKQSRLNALIAALKEQSLEVETYETQKAGDATEFLQKRTLKDEIVVAVGGDGTTREVINGLSDNTPLAVFANGTANVLANELNLPKSARAMAKLIAKGNTLPIQFGRLNEERFCMWVGIGFDAWVVAKTNLNVKRKIGKAAYAISMFTQAFGYGRPQYKVQVDDKDYISYSAIITHARFYGGRFVLSQKANLKTPKLYALLFQKPGRLFFFKALFALLFGKMESVDGVVSIPFEKINIELVDDSTYSDSQRQLANALQADGDIVASLPLQVELDKKVVSILV